MTRRPGNAVAPLAKYLRATVFIYLYSGSCGSASIKDLVLSYRDCRPDDLFWE